MSDDAGAAVKQQRLPPLPRAEKRTEGVKKKRPTRLQRRYMIAELLREHEM